MMSVRALLAQSLGVLAAALALALWPARLVRRRFGRTRCLWTGAPIGTLALNARAERLLGFESRSLVTHTYYITDAFDYDLSAWRSLPLVGYLVPFAVFVWACAFVDRVHLFCDRGILPTARRFGFHALEFAVYRWLRLDVFLWTYGADVRSRAATQALGEPNCCTDCTQVGAACICDEAVRRDKMARLARHARAVFAMGDMIEYTPGSRNDLFFWPIDLQADAGARYRPEFPTAHPERSLRVVHAPNHRMFKGTRYLEQAVAELRAEGVAIELVLVEKVPNREALALYRSADVIFDQCLIGFHGYFALEGMALGKPVMCFIRKPDEYLLDAPACPIVNTHVRTLKEDLRALAGQRDRLEAIGRASRAYVERYFSIEAFAERLGRTYRELGVMA